MTAALQSFDPDAPTSEIAATLSADGGVIIANLVPEELIDQVYAEVNRNTSEAQRKTGGGLTWPEGNRTVGGMGGVSPTYTENLLLHPRALEVADAILLPDRPMGPNTQRPSASEKTSDDPYGGAYAEVVENDAGNTQLVWSPADPTKGPKCHYYNLGAGVMLEVHRGSRNQALHRERSIYEPYIGLPATRELVVSMNWAGTDFTRENGATRVVPGSHLWPEERIAKEEEVAEATMPKGSVLIWLTRTLHGAGANHTDEGRIAFFGSYVVNWLRQEENQYIVVPPEVAEQLSSRAQQIIGYRCGENCGYVKGRDQDFLLREGQSSPL